MTDSPLPWRVPVVQAPIGPAATPALAAAVSEAGGIGSLGASWTEPGMLRAQIREIRRRTERPFMVNLVLAFEQEFKITIPEEDTEQIKTVKDATNYIQTHAK